MPRFLITALTASLFLFAQGEVKRIEKSYDEQKNVTTVRSRSIQLSGPKDRYHSLAYSIYYSYPGQTASPPKHVNFELVSVVKARRLSTDLYVRFVVEGKEIHFSSKRSAIERPVPGRLWIGERMVFRIPYDQFQKMAQATSLSVKLGGVSFGFSKDHLGPVRDVALSITDPVSAPSGPPQTSPRLL